MQLPDDTRYSHSEVFAIYNMSNAMQLINLDKPILLEAQDTWSTYQRWRFVLHVLVFEASSTLPSKFTLHMCLSSTKELFFFKSKFPFAGTGGIFPACHQSSDQKQDDSKQCLCCHGTQHLHVQRLSIQGDGAAGVLHGNQHSQHRPAAHKIPKSALDGNWKC